MNKNIIVAIDGPSGSGKSTIAKLVAKKLNLEHLDTGAMYRSLAYKLVKEKKEFELKDLDNFNLKIDKEKFYLDGEDITEKIRENEISKKASDVSKIKEVREYMVDFQRRLSKEKSIILDGRDIGTVVFPNANFKIYLTASAEKRAYRRYLESKEDYEKILEDMKKRDEQDKNRKYSPLKVAEDAIIIDTTDMNVEKVVQKIVEIIKGD